MASKWTNYFDIVDGHEVSILVDLNFEQRASSEELSDLVFLGLKIVDPTDRGFPTKDEWSKLGAIEDAVSAQLAVDQVHQHCGSLTTSGVRTLYFYSSAPVV